MSITSIILIAQLHLKESFNDLRKTVK